MPLRNYFTLRRRPMIGYSVVCVCLLAIMIIVRSCGEAAENLAQIDVSEENAEPVRITRHDQANDTLHINTANATQLRHAGFSYYVSMRLLMFCEAGGRFRSAQQLKKFSGIDTVLIDKMMEQNLLRFDLQKPRNVFAQAEKKKKREYYSNIYSKKRSVSGEKRPRIPRRPWFRLTAAEMDSLEVDPEVRDSVLEYQKRYVLRGSVREDSLVLATADEIWNLVMPNVDGLRQSRSKKDKVQKIRLELNTATLEQLSKLRWVKEYTARRIVAHRDSLGGFAHVSQLLEVASIDEERLQRIAPQIEVDASRVKKIKVNQVTDVYLVRHPYFGKALAQTIYLSRRKKPFVDYDDFVQRLENYELPEYLEVYLDFSQKEKKK